MTDSDVRASRYQTWDAADLAAATGHTIRVLRTDQGLSRAELAERAGISYSYLSAIENGTKPPSTKIQMALAETLGMKVHELLELAESRTIARRLPGRGSTPGVTRYRSTRHTPAADIPAGSALRGEPERRTATASLMDRDLHREAMQLRARAELTELIAEMGEADIEFLLEMARKLAGRRRA